jgi:hypothetical protein
MKEHVQKCQEWAGHLGIQMKSVALSNPKMVLYGLALLALVSWLLLRATQYFKKPTDYPPRTPDVEKRGSYFKAPPREPGGLYHSMVTKLAIDGLTVWEPMDFKRPTAPPAPDWDVHTSKPKPYRPFRHGPYHITMGLRNMNWDEWIGEFHIFSGSSKSSQLIVTQSLTATT